MQPSKGPFSLVKFTWLWFAISLTVIAIGFFFMVTRGFNMGVDFTGGTSLLLGFEQLPKFADVRTAFNSPELKALDLSKLQLQAAGGKDLVIKVPPLTPDQQKAVLKVLAAKLEKFEVLESDTIGPTIGAELKNLAGWILVWVLGLLLVYIAFRFEIWYAVAAILALVHDALITCGVASCLGLEINGQFIAAILTILGYSINDTIVIFDRMRENSKKFKHQLDITEITDASLWQTMTRSVNTVLTVLIPLAMIFLFGGVTIREFALIMFIGITSGTYSSIFIAAPLYLKLKKLEA
jgi:preprotein translocase subunit SecF